MKKKPVQFLRVAGVARDSIVDGPGVRLAVFVQGCNIKCPRCHNGDPSKNLEAFESIVRAMHDAGIGYGAINHPLDFDPVCGFSGVIDNECPGCGRKADEKVQRVRRIVGYLAPVDRWNAGKLAELKDRRPHCLRQVSQGEKQKNTAAELTTLG